MKLAIVRGDFLSSWEIPIFLPLTKNNEVTIFIGRWPVYKVNIPKEFKVVRLPCPVDLNFGTISRWKMAILNRLFIDAHVLFGLEEKLKGYDIAYTAETFYSFTHQCLVAKRKGYIKKVVMHVGENIAFNDEGIWGRKSRKQEALRETDKFIAITDQAKDVLISEGADPKKIIRATQGIDLEKFKPKVEKSCGNLVKNDSVKLLVISRLVPEKGITEIIDYFIKLKKEKLNVELIIIGVGPIMDQMQQKADESGYGSDIYFMGRIADKDIPCIYNLCDIFVHYPKGSKTWLEQFGFVLTEAMASGLPIIALNRGSIKEVVSDAGLVLSEKEFYPELKKLVKDKKYRKNFAQKALTFARKNYDAKNYSKKLEEIFYQVLKE